MSGRGSEFVENRQDIAATMNALDDVLVLKGAIPIRTAGSLLGAVGVNGAAGGEVGEACAQVAIDAVAEELELAD